MRCLLITHLVRNLVAYQNQYYVKCAPLVHLFSQRIHIDCVSFKSKPVWGTNKEHRSIKIIFKQVVMADPQIEEILAPLRADVKSQGDIVRQLKASGAPELDVKKAVAELKVKKKILDDKELELTPAAAFFNRARMEDLLKRRFYYDQSFSIYGGITGQYDFGPMGCAIKTNLLNAWRNFFILEEQMLEVDCSILTPEPVLKASGHVDRFADLMVKDTVNGECFRLDHLIKSHLEKLCASKDTKQETIQRCESILTKLDGLNKNELQDILTEFNIMSPLTGNKLTEPIEFNLMFGTQIGPTGLIKGFLRPETAQGIFVNFKRLLEFNQGRLPFAAAQIGNAFRNEISPRSGLLRVREFTMAEIEHFCDPEDKSHPKFASVADQVMLLYSACNQMDGKPAERVKIGDAVQQGMVANETLGYFMARIHLFLVSIGIDPTKLRFRQHMSNEMAHYACDCWDAECLTSYGWIECVGCADRSAYDLKQHTKATKVRLAAEKRLPAPETIDATQALPKKDVIGKTFKKDAKIICDKLNDLSLNEVFDLQNELNENKKFDLVVGDKTYELNKDMVTIQSVTKTVNVKEIIPNVIEPSFGIGRIMYSLFEHNFCTREGDENRTYFSLPPVIAPLKCSVLPLSNKKEFSPFVEQLSKELLRKGIALKVDDSAGSIGKRYTRTDEVAIPFAITIDFDSLQEPHSVTLRERDSTRQLRIPVNEVTDVVKQLIDGSLSWVEAEGKYPIFEQQETTK